MQATWECVLKQNKVSKNHGPLYVGQAFKNHLHGFAINVDGVKWREGIKTLLLRRFLTVAAIGAASCGCSNRATADAAVDECRNRKICKNLSSIAAWCLSIAAFIKNFALDAHGNSILVNGMAKTSAQRIRFA